MNRYEILEVERFRIECRKCSAVVELSLKDDRVLPPQLCPGCKEFLWEETENSAAAGTFMHLRRALRCARAANSPVRIELEFREAGPGG